LRDTYVWVLGVAISLILFGGYRFMEEKRGHN
jgi:hypothetical protein